jgi:WD40 repeat protein
VAFTPDGRFLATAGDAVRLYGLGDEAPVQQFKGAPGLVRSIAVSPDGKTIATAGGDGTVLLWDVAGRKLSGALRGHTHAATVVAFSPDGKALASGSADKTVRLWDVDRGAELAAFEATNGAITALAFRPDGSFLASSSQGEPGARLWDVVHRRPSGAISPRGATAVGDTTALAFSTDGGLLYAGTERGIAVWDVPQGLRTPAPAGGTDR